MREQAAPRFDKAKILRSLTVAPVHKDVLRTVLRDDEQYTLDQARGLIVQFASRKVN